MNKILCMHHPCFCESVSMDLEERIKKNMALAMEQVKKLDFLAFNLLF